ncbi:MAG: hypothetical protein ACUVTG_06140 [Candidatus Oleimicrobiaceae bacterium]
MKRDNEGGRAGVGLICVRDLMRFVEILEVHRLLQKAQSRAVLLAMTPCLVDAIAEPMLADLPHQLLHAPFDSRRVEEAVKRLMGREGALVVVEVLCPDDATQVVQAAEAISAHLVVTSADLRQSVPPPAWALQRAVGMRLARAAAV